jgi:hypothetical protein
MTDYSSIIPVRPGQNFAPLNPLLSLQESKGQSHYLADALKERFKHFWNLEQAIWREMILAGELVGRFIQGDQILERNPWTGGWLTIRPQREDDSVKRALNLMQFYVTNCITKWMLSNPDITVKPGRDTDESVMASKAGAIIVDHYENEFFDPWFNEQEALLALTFGTYLSRLRYDASVEGAIAFREITENREIRLGDGAGYCGDCGHAGVADEFPGQAEGMQPLCPRCGSEYVLVEPPATDTIPTVIGQEPVQTGDLVLDQLPFSACRWDLTKRAEKSSWFIYQQRVSLGSIRRLLGRVKIPGNPSESDLGLNVAQSLAYSGQAVDGRGNHRRNTFLNQDQVNLCEMWLSPDDYADIDVKGDEQTVDGQPLPAGAKLTDLFPKGLVAVGLNGMATVLGIYAERHSDHIASGVWHMKLMSGAGRGGQDMVEVQKRLNKLDSQQLAYMDAAATPAILADKMLIDDDQAGYLGNPKANVFVNLHQLPETKRLADAVLPLTPQSVPGQFVQYVQSFLTQAFATTSHATDFTNGGLMNQSNDTARGAMIADANANSIFGPLLAIKGLVRQSIAEKVVELYRRHFPIKQWFPLAGKYGRQQGIWLSGVDLKADLRFEVVKESELPQNSVTKRDNAMAFFMGLFGGFQNYLAALQQSPALVAELARLWNVKTEFDDFDVTAQVCRRRLEQMKAALQMGMADPFGLVMAIQPPISPMEPEKTMREAAIWFQDFLLTDEGLDSPMELRAAVEVLVQQLFQLSGQQQAAIAMQGAQVQAAGAAMMPQQPPTQEAKQ